MAEFRLSAMGPSIAEQAAQHGLQATGMSLELADRIHHGLVLAYIHGTLTDSELDRARRRLLKAAKFKQA